MHPYESKRVRKTQEGSPESALRSRHFAEPSIYVSIDFHALETEDTAQGPPKLECPILEPS